MDRLVSERARPYFEKAQKLAPIIREHADRAEREAQMPREVIDAFHDAGLFRILLPRQMGGGELTIPDTLRLVRGSLRASTRRRDGISRFVRAVRCSDTTFRARHLKRFTAIRAA